MGNNHNVKEHAQITKALKGGARLIVGEKYIGDSGISFLIKNETNSIQHLNMARNNITEKGMLIFSQGRWDSLTSILLSHNSIGNKGCKFLTKASLMHLTSLDLTSNSIESAGIFHLSKAQWKKLEWIIFQSNKLEADAMRWYVRMYATQLEHIELNGYQNCLTKSEMAHLLLAKWKKNPSFRLWSGYFQDKSQLIKLLVQKMPRAQIKG